MIESKYPEKRITIEFCSTPEGFDGDMVDEAMMALEAKSVLCSLFDYQNLLKREGVTIETLQTAFYEHFSEALRRLK